MSKVKVEFEFDLQEELNDYEVLMRCHKMYFAIQEIDASLRLAYKHNDEIGDEAYRLIEEWRAILGDSGVLDF